ncbi:MAG TPA: PRC-barrel domain-containing protein [Methanobacterium sp.]|jgi:sporulation protein YlmC with PRC-barrel domain|nr:MAG: photosystem reaction center subunit H [Methanobacterium sp.]HOI71166.1 PRC-barrel domain-containing protein [Methanobacterium sp.]
MKINNDLIGKEVIDNLGDQIGVVEDVEWNPSSNSIESLELKEAGVSAKLGLGEKTIVPINLVDTIGDKVIVRGHHFTKE